MYSISSQSKNSREFHITTIDPETLEMYKFAHVEISNDVRSLDPEKKIAIQHLIQQTPPHLRGGF